MKLELKYLEKYLNRLRNDSREVITLRNNATISPARVGQALPSAARGTHRAAVDTR